MYNEVKLNTIHKRPLTIKSQLPKQEVRIVSRRGN